MKLVHVFRLCLLQTPIITGVAAIRFHVVRVRVCMDNCEILRELIVIIVVELQVAI